jgi:hypothetical protein
MIPAFTTAVGLGANDVGMFDAVNRGKWGDRRSLVRAVYRGLTANRPQPYPGLPDTGAGSIDDAANFTCVKTIQAHVRIEPETLKLGSGGTFTAFVTLPYQGDWRVTSAVCEGAPAVKLTRHGHSYKATFNKQDLKSITVRDAVTFTVFLLARPLLWTPNQQEERHKQSDKSFKNEAKMSPNL